MKIKVKKIYSEWWAYVWLHRKLMGWVALSGVLVGLVVWLSIPNEYETDIFTVAEPRVVYVDQYGAVTNRNSIGAERIRDAILPSHYRRLMASPTFLLPLTRIPVTLDDDEHTSMTLYDYMAEHQRYPWWRYVVSGVLSIPRLMFLPFRGGGEDNPSPSGSLRETLPADREGIVRLTRKDARVLSALRRRLDTEISAEKQSVTLKVRMQDPLVSATVADSLLAHLHRYMNRYRREKELQLLAENEELLRQTREDYHRAQDEYARYADSHRALATAAARAEQHYLPRSVFKRVIHPFLQLFLIVACACRIVRRAQVNDIRLHTVVRHRKEIIFFSSVHVNDFLSIHCIRIHIDRVDRIRDQDHIVLRKKFRNIPRIALRAVGNKHVIRIHFHTVSSIIICNRFTHERIPLLRAVSLKCL